MHIHVLGTVFLDKYSKRYAPLAVASVMRNEPSQLLENFPLSFRALLRMRQTKSPL